MKTMIRLKMIFFCSILLVINSKFAAAQLYDELAKECYKMQTAFSDTGYLGFTIKHFYSTEKRPTVYTDSVVASMKIHKGNYYGKFKSAEYLQNNRYLITIYRDNNSIVVSNPVIGNRRVMPMANIDAAFLANDVDSAWISESGNIKTIKFRFTDSSAFKSYTINYDKKTYRLQKITYSLKQKYLNPADTAYLPENPFITVLVTGYSNAAFSDAIFDHTQFVVKDTTANQFKGTGIYKDYQVMSTYREADPPGGYKSFNFLEKNYCRLNSDADKQKAKLSSFRQKNMLWKAQAGLVSSGKRKFPA